jgi:hypothetical protein
LSVAAVIAVAEKVTEKWQNFLKFIFSIKNNKKMILV